MAPTKKKGAATVLVTCHSGKLESPADITILAPDLKVRIRASQLRSRSKNTPFDGWELRGGVAATIIHGRTVYVNPEMGSGVI